MKQLSDLIIERTGARTDEEITAAFIGWARANIDYSVQVSALPMDALAAKKGNCLTYAILITQLLRLQGIRSVAVDGWRKDLRQYTADDWDALGWAEGHAWIYVLLDGNWTMFDPLWSAEMPVTDREYIASWYFPSTIEGVTMTYDGNKVFFNDRGPINIYEDGRFMYYYDGEPCGGSVSYILNNLILSYTAYRGAEYPYEFLDAPGEAENMIYGQVYNAGRWLKWGDEYLLHCYENGIHPYATIVEYEGNQYYAADEYLVWLHKDVKGYWFEQGYFYLPIGFQGYVFGEPILTPGVYEDTVRSYSVSEWNDADVSITEDGYLSVNGPGYVVIEYRDTASDDGRLFGSGYKTFFAGEQKPVCELTFRQWDIRQNFWYEMEEGPYYYAGGPITPKIHLYEPQILDPSIGKPLREGIDYTVTYQNNHAPGKATALIRGKGNYTGELKAEFTIEKAPIMPTSINIRESQIEIVSGKPYQLNFTLSPSDADQNLLKWTSADENIVIVDQNGKVTGKNYGKTTVTVTTINGLSDSVNVSVLFKDVADASRYFYDPVYWAAQNGITVGAGGVGKFSPDAFCTREQFVTFLWRLNKEPEPENDCEFSDVNKTDWYYKPIAWAYENNITTGLNDETGRFGVGQPCTREQCVTFLYRSAGQPSYYGERSFTDVEEGRYFYDAIRWAAWMEITVGLNDGTGRFGVGQKCTRGMLVTFLYRFAVPGKG